MNPGASTRTPYWVRDRVGLGHILIASLVVSILAISRESLWIDESYSAIRAVQPDLASWWRMMMMFKGSELQMPLYMVYLWGWVKLFGSSEWALRAANIPWFLLAQTAFWLGLPRWMRIRLAIAICALCYPFLWSYLNEARPYLMEYSGAAVVSACLASLAALDRPEIDAKWIWAFFAGLWILCASSALGIPWAAAAVFALACLTWGKAQIHWSPSAIAGCLAGVLALAGLAAYYRWTTLVGGGAFTGLGGGVATFFFAGYEMLGFAGLGPSRIEVREAWFSPFIPYLPVLAVLGLLFLLVMAAAVSEFAQFGRARERAALGIYLFFPLALIGIFAFKSGFRVLGRHLIPEVPAILWLVAVATSSVWKKGTRWHAGCALGLLAVWVVSALELRFTRRHKRDDYRTAAVVANAALVDGKEVWWCASQGPAIYYHVKIKGDEPNSKGIRLIWWPVPKDLSNLKPPDIVLFSKASLTDPNGALSSYLHDHQYRQTDKFPAFTAWEK